MRLFQSYLSQTVHDARDIQISPFWLLKDYDKFVEGLCDKAL